MFVNKNQKQEFRNQKFSQTVLKENSLRRMNQDAITQDKPAYYDKLQNDFQDYLGIRKCPRDFYRYQWRQEHHLQQRLQDWNH